MFKKWKTPGGTVPGLCADILNQPHTLIAGTTGAGKSVLLHGIIYTALSCSPNHLGLILIDPKRVELRDYKDLPHTLGYYTEPKEIAAALEHAVDIMNGRFERMARKGRKTSAEGKIIIAIDEYFDVKLLAGSRAVNAITQLALKGRAANMQVIACTQRPTRDVVTGAIKGCFVSQVALRTADRQESVNLIGCSGCERLPMHGEAFYRTPELPSWQRVVIPYVTPEKLSERVAFWYDQLSPFDRLALKFRA